MKKNAKLIKDIFNLIIIFKSKINKFKVLKEIKDNNKGVFKSYRTRISNKLI